MSKPWEDFAPKTAGAQPPEEEGLEASVTYDPREWVGDKYVGLPEQNIGSPWGAYGGEGSPQDAAPEAVETAPRQAPGAGGAAWSGLKSVPLTWWRSRRCSSRSCGSSSSR